MIVVGVRDDDGVECPGVEGEVSIRAVRIHPVGVEESAVEQDFMPADFQKMGATGYLPRPRRGT